MSQLETFHSLADEYPKQQARCRELLESYRAIGPAGAFGYRMISGVIEEADAASASGDLPRMIAAFRAMEGCE